MSKNKPKLKFEEDYKMLVLNTCHVSKQDRDILATPFKPFPSDARFRDLNPLTRFENEYGCVIKLWNSDGLENLIEDIKQYGYSEKIVELVRALFKLGYSYILFDRDAEISEHFTTYDW